MAVARRSQRTASNNSDWDPEEMEQACRNSMVSLQKEVRTRSRRQNRKPKTESVEAVTIADLEQPSQDKEIKPLRSYKRRRSNRRREQAVPADSCNDLQKAEGIAVPELSCVQEEEPTEVPQRPADENASAEVMASQDCEEPPEVKETCLGTEEALLEEQDCSAEAPEPLVSPPAKRKRKTGGKRKKLKTDMVRTHFGIPAKDDELLPEGDTVDLDLLVDDDDSSGDIQPGERSTSGNRIAFPSRNDPDAVDIDETDMLCLSEEEYLNDTVIDFYIKHLKIALAESNQQVHVFNSFFYTKLREVVCKHESLQEQSCKLKKLRKWMRGINIFDKRYLLMPIHDKQHWSLAVICFLGSNSEGYVPCSLLHLDSMRIGHLSTIVYEVLRRYLALEWNLQHNDVKAIRQKEIHVRKVKVPQQDNGYDCGLFLLHFIEKFVSKAPEKFELDVVKDMFSWFKATEASELRIIIRQLIQRQFKQALAVETLQDRKETSEEPVEKPQGTAREEDQQNEEGKACEAQAELVDVDIISAKSCDPAAVEGGDCTAAEGGKCTEAQATVAEDLECTTAEAQAGECTAGEAEPEPAAEAGECTTAEAQDGEWTEGETAPEPAAEAGECTTAEVQVDECTAPETAPEPAAETTPEPAAEAGECTTAEAQVGECTAAEPETAAELTEITAAEAGGENDGRTESTKRERTEELDGAAAAAADVCETENAEEQAKKRRQKRRKRAC